ncbi:YceI family protein [Chitinophagaceae bacterium LWZ2-11]
MKKILVLAVSLVLALNFLNAQTYKSRDGYLTFNPNKDQSHKDYAAASKEATSVLKVETTEVALLVPMKTFHFNNALLEEHFNDNYLQSDKFPNASYKGKLIGFTKDMLAKDGVYNLTSEGQVTLHGVTKNFKSTAKLEVKGKVATFTCDFPIKAEEYNINIPGIVKPKLADQTPISAVIKFQLN